MQHSYDSLDRPGGFSRVQLLAPLRHRDFALLWGGQTGSLIGDGIFLVAMAWQVYAISNAPTALIPITRCRGLRGSTSTEWRHRPPPPGCQSFLVGW